VTPVDTTTEQPQQEDTSDQPVQQSGPSGGDKGKGKDKGGGPGKGHGGGPGKGKG
jgi:hypothetical protein